MNNGELFDYIQASNKNFPERLAKYYFKQLIEALHHMHLNMYIHRDLKLENLLLDENFDLKLSDFGLSKKMN